MKNLISHDPVIHPVDEGKVAVYLNFDCVSHSALLEKLAAHSLDTSLRGVAEGIKIVSLEKRRLREDLIILCNYSLDGCSGVWIFIFFQLTNNKR